MRRRSELLVVSTALMLLLAACGGSADTQVDVPVADSDAPTDAPPPAEPEQADPGDALTVEDLAGVWLNDAPAQGIPAITFWLFGADGAFLAMPVGRFHDPGVIGTYELDGDVLTVTNDDGPDCGPGESWVERADLVADGQLRIEIIESSGPCRLDPGTTWSQTRLSPRSLDADPLRADVAEETGKPVTVVSALKGVWLLEGTGSLLAVWEEQPGSFSYQLDDAGRLGTDPGDAGSVELVEDGTFTFTSGPASRLCADGDVMTWTDVDLLRGTLNHEVVDNVFVVRAAANDPCLDLAGSTMTWIRLATGS